VNLVHKLDHELKCQSRIVSSYMKDHIIFKSIKLKRLEIIYF